MTIILVYYSTTNMDFKIKVSNELAHFFTPGKKSFEISPLRFARLILEYVCRNCVRVPDVNKFIINEKIKHLLDFEDAEVIMLSGNEVINLIHEKHCIL